VTLRPVSLGLAGLALLIALASALHSTAIPVHAGLLLAAVWLLAVVRPHAALLALAVSVPLGPVFLAALNAAPVGDTEALVIVTLSGTMIAAARPRLTTLRPQRPTIVIPGVVLCAVAAWSSLTTGFADVAYVPEGVALMFAVARHARDGVMRPIHLLRATVIGGLITIAIALGRQQAGAANTAGSHVSMTGLLAFDPRRGVLGVVGLAACLWMGTAAAVRVSRGLRANPNDRLLVGSAGALVAFLVAWLTSHRLQLPDIAYLFWILLGATFARADGDAQPPLALQIDHE
jgi:hypothetical protein